MATWIASIDQESRALVLAVAKVGLDASVPTCPAWQVRDLVQHLGGVHRWATAHVADGRTEALPKDETAALMASHPGDEDLSEWFIEGHQRLCQVLAAAPADLRCWSFLPAPSPLAFWARRQAHETEIHRADVEFAASSQAPTFSAEIAADGIEEMLYGFATLPRRLELESPFQIALLPIERPDGWVIELGPERVHAQRGPAMADCRVRGTASDLYLWLWNRLPSTALEVDGNEEALASWRRTMRVNWSRT